VRPEDISQAVREKPIGREAEAETDDEAIRQWVRGALSSRRVEHMFDSYMDRFASLLVSEALRFTAGNRSRAAKLLGLSRPTLHSKIEKYNLKLETSVKED
jgi:DNA-binding protein Fis